MLRYSFGMEEEAAIEGAVRAALADGNRTADIASSGEPVVGTAAMADAIIAHLGINMSRQ